MAKSVWRHPWLTYPKPLAMALEEFHESMIPQRLKASLSSSAHQEQIGACSFLRAFKHHIRMLKVNYLGPSAKEVSLLAVKEPGHVIECHQ
jgi:hypothetical protein